MTRKIRGIPPYIILHEEKEVLFYIPSGFPTTMIVPTLMRKHFPDDYKGLVISKPEAWKRFGGKL